MKKIVSAVLIVSLMVLTVWANLPAVSGNSQSAQQLDENSMSLITGFGLFGCLAAIGTLARGIFTICMGAIFWGSFTVSSALIAMLEKC